MKVAIVAVSQRPPGWVQDGYDSYAKRLPADWQVDLKIVKPADRQAGKTPAQNMAIEAQRLEIALKTIPGTRVALDEHGKALDTSGFLKAIETEHDRQGGIVFVIGGPDGLETEFKRRCALSIQLSAMTLPHALVKVLLIEQIYRAYSLATGHPYHRP